MARSRIFPPIFLRMSSQVVILCAFVLGSCLADDPTTTIDSSFLSGFEFWHYCRNTWFCRRNWDGSVTLSTYYNGNGGFSSQRQFLHGVFSVQWKLPPRNSNGIVHAFYLNTKEQYPNNDMRHAEIDFELIGADKTQEGFIATNIIVGGYQYLQHHKFPHDPSEEFHTYTITWGPDRVVWYVDDTPIRVTVREEKLPWPSSPLVLMGSIWDASAWTPQKTDFRAGPVAMQMKDFKVKACSIVSTEVALPTCAHNPRSPDHPWNSVMGRIEAEKLILFNASSLIQSTGWKQWIANDAPIDWSKKEAAM